MVDFKDLMLVCAVGSERGKIEDQMSSRLEGQSERAHC